MAASVSKYAIQKAKVFSVGKPYNNTMVVEGGVK